MSIGALSYNAYVAQIGVMAVVQTQQSAGVEQGVDAAFNTIVPQMLAYAENRIQRDLDLLASQTTNTYTLTPGASIFPIPAADFLTVQTVAVQAPGNLPLLPVSKEFIQNCYGGPGGQGPPQYFSLIGDNFGDGADSNMNMLLGPVPNYPFTITVTGTIRMPSLATYAAVGVADTQYTYISQFYPDLLIMASMIYISAFQRNFSATAGDADMSMSFEKQYQLLRVAAVEEENRKKGMGSAWTPYSTPTSATPTR